MADGISKMKMETVDQVRENVEKIAALFPNCVTEKETADGKLEKGINWKMLKQMLKDKVIDGEEAYEFTWVGKKAAVVEANKPIRKTLRPCKEESKNWDTTENLYIEGDNLEALKLLQESYLGKVKMIYIDPPYNTGHDFVYPDSFKMGEEEYNEGTKYFAEDGTINFSRENSKQAGKYHSDWCSMIYSRLILARNLLSDDGVIFISIDDNEQEHLKTLANEALGENNFIAQLIWERAFSPKNDAKYVSNSHDYVLMFAKNIDNFNIGRLPRTEEANSRYNNPDNDPRGPWMSSDISVKTYSAANDYPITTPSGRTIEPPAGRCWRLSQEAFRERLLDNRIWFGPKGDGVPRIKRFLSELKHDGMAPTSIMFFKEVGHSQEGAQEVSKLLDGGFFSGPKPVRLLQRLSILANLDKDSVILDFFSGSATTAHTVMQLNAEDGGHRKFIMVQLPEPTDKKSEAYKAGYKNICEIGKERIRRAGDKIVADNADKEGIVDLDIGFRVLKVDSSNMNDVYYGAEDYSQELLLQLEDNIKSDRSDLDLLFGCIVDWGLELSCPYSSTKIEGYTVHNYNDGDLIACFAKDIPESVIKAIAKMEPMRAVFRDSGFADSPAKINVTEIFKRLAPDTEIRVL